MMDHSWRRASGEVVCLACGEKYKKHPLSDYPVDWQGEPWLRRLCDGSLVKT